MNFQNAKIVSVNTQYSLYSAESFERGDVRYTVRGHALSEMFRNPKRFIDGYEPPDTKAKRGGNMLDALAFSGDQFASRYCVSPETYTNKDGKVCKWRDDDRIEAVTKWKAENQGKTVVSSGEMTRGLTAFKKLRECERAAEFLDSGPSQVWVQGEYHDITTGLVIPVKCLIDKAPHADHMVFSNAIGDLKTTNSAHPYKFARQCFDLHYHWQAAMDLDLYNAATGEIRSEWLHIVQEAYPPYFVRTPFLGERFISLGRAMVQEALSRYCQYITTKQWPGYDDPGVSFPITEPEDWMMDMKLIWKSIEEPEEPTVREEKTDLIP